MTTSSVKSVAGTQPATKQDCVQTSASPALAGPIARLGNFGLQCALEAKLKVNGPYDPQQGQRPLALEPAHTIQLRGGSTQVAQDVLTFANGEEVTEKSLIGWVLRQKSTPEQVIRQIRSGHAFKGSAAARERFVRIFEAALAGGTLDELRMWLDTVRAEQLVQEQEARFAQEAAALDAQARVMDEAGAEVAGAMAALGDADPELASIYADLLALEGDPADLERALSQGMHPENVQQYKQASLLAVDERYGRRPDDLKAPLRASIVERLRQRGLTIEVLKKRAARFEESFRNAAVHLALGWLDGAKQVCVQYLEEVGALETLTADMTRALDMTGQPRTPREKILAQIDKADDVRHAHLFGAMDPETWALSPQPSLQDANKDRKEALGSVVAVLSDQPFVAWPDFDREAFLRKDRTEALSFLSRYFEGHVRSLTTATEDLIHKPELIYRFDLALAEASAQLLGENSSAQSIPALIIQEQRKRAADGSAVQKLATILAFALAVTSVFVPGGIVAAAAAWTGAGLGIHGAWEALQEYGEDQAAYEVGLKNVPGHMLWVIWSLLSRGLALLLAVKALNGLPGFKEAIQRFSDAKQLGKAQRLALLAGDMQAVPGLSDTTRAIILRDAERILLDPDMAVSQFDPILRGGYRALQKLTSFGESDEANRRIALELMDRVETDMERFYQLWARARVKRLWGIGVRAPRASVKPNLNGLLRLTSRRPPPLRPMHLPLPPKPSGN